MRTRRSHLWGFTGELVRFLNRPWRTHYGSNGSKAPSSGSVVPLTPDTTEHSELVEVAAVVLPKLPRGAHFGPKTAPTSFSSVNLLYPSFPDFSGVL